MRQTTERPRGKELIYGKHSVRAVFYARPEAVRRLVLLEEATRYLDEFRTYASRAGIAPEVLPRSAFLRLGGFRDEEKHQGVFVFTAPRTVHSETELSNLATARIVLALDQVSNPENFGTMLRNAAFFGVDAVLWMKDRAVGLTPTVFRVAVGGVEFVELFQITNLARSLDTLKSQGFWVYGLDERGESTLAETDFASRNVIVIGAEGEGLRRRTKDHCDTLVRIAGGRQGLESLNAGVAAAIALAELTREPGRLPQPSA